MTRYGCKSVLIMSLLFVMSGAAHALNGESGSKDILSRFPDRLIWPSKTRHILNMPGCLDYTRPGWISPNIQKIAVRPRPEIYDGEEGWFGEEYYLDIYLRNEKRFAIPFYAAHGSFDAMLAEDLWQSRNAYVLLIRQITKGTGVSEHELDIFEAKNGTVKTLLERKIAGYFDFFGDLWRYRLSISLTGIDSEKPFYGLELRYEQDHAAEEFIRKGFVAKDAQFGKDMPNVVCLIFHDQELREYEGKRCHDIHKME